MDMSSYGNAISILDFLVYQCNMIFLRLRSYNCKGIRFNISNETISSEILTSLGSIIEPPRHGNIWFYTKTSEQLRPVIT